MGAVACMPSPVSCRFGTGHTLTLRVPPDQLEAALAFVEATFPGAELREAHGNRLRFQLPPAAGCTLERVFRELAVQGQAHGVEDFSVNQTTLEEVMSATVKELEGESRGPHHPELRGADVSLPPVPLCPLHVSALSGVPLFLQRPRGRGGGQPAGHRGRGGFQVQPAAPQP